MYGWYQKFSNFKNLYSIITHLGYSLQFELKNLVVIILQCIINM